MNNKYNLIFEGKILSGFCEKDVRENLSNLLNIPESQRDMFFSGREIELKKDLTLDQALHLKQRLGKHGIDVLMVSTAFADLSLTIDKAAMRSASSTTEQMRAQRHELDETARKRREQYRAEYNQIVQAQSDKYDKNPHKPPSPFGISFEGRYGRMNYFNAILIWFIGIIMLTLAIVLFLGIEDENAGIFSLLSIIQGMCTYRIAVLRAHDLNLSGWFCLLLFIPVVGFIFSVCLLFIRGTDGENGYGSEPDQGSFSIIVLIVVIVLLVILFRG